MTTQDPSAADAGLRALLAERRQLTSLAYRLLGSLTDAEDVFQETSARWYAMTPEQRAAIENPAAWATRVAGRICLDQLRSARRRKEDYMGEWLPEPVPGGTEWLDGRVSDPAEQVTLDESLTMAFLVVLDAMTPAERVTFVLHDVFGYPFAEVAEIVGRTPAACRQLAVSARRRVRDARTPAVPTSEQADLVRDFRIAWEAKDIAALVDVLDTDVAAVADSGGRASTVFDAVSGSASVARTFVELTSLRPDLTVTECVVNGRPGLLVRQDGTAASVLAFDVADGRITRIWAVRNPDKLQSWGDVQA